MLDFCSIFVPQLRNFRVAQKPKECGKMPVPYYKFIPIPTFGKALSPTFQFMKKEAFDLRTNATKTNVRNA
jgi:hypothetical protein